MPIDRGTSALIPSCSHAQTTSRGSALNKTAFTYVELTSGVLAADALQVVRDWSK